MGIANKILPHYTYDDWMHWEGKWELLEGHPIAMSPTPIPKHQRVAAELITEFNLALRSSTCKTCRVYDAMDYKISADTILVPDILIVCGDIEKKILDFAPALVVEILSPATALRDRNTKFQLYEQQGVRYHLIADVEKEIIEVYQLQNAEYHQLPTGPAPFVLNEHCTLTPNLTSVFL